MDLENRKILAANLPVLFFLGVVMYNLLFDTEVMGRKAKFDKSAPVYFSHIKMLDTIHLLGDNYIEINLKTQNAVLHRRNDTSLIYRISSGTDRISEGINTTEGFFTVQTKLEVAVSKQFEDAKLLYWLGFNGNIGFHGLQTSGYYAHLGRRPSSHGCVRIGRDDAKDLYTRVKRGTPVIVHYGKYALTPIFSDYKNFVEGYDFLLSNNSRVNKKIFESRLKNLYLGRSLRENRGRLFVDGTTIMKPFGFDIGDYSKVPNNQLRPIILPLKYKFHGDNLIVNAFLPDTNQIPKVDSDSTLSKNYSK